MSRALAVLVWLGPLGVLAGDGTVDWERQVLRVTGNGPPDVKASNAAQARLGAERSARDNALAALRERVQGLPLRADRTVGEELADGDARRRLDPVLQGYRVVRTRYFSDGGVRLEVELPLGVLTEALVNPSGPVGVPGPGKPTEDKAPAEGKHTGVVVDARALGMTAMLAPRLVDDTTGQPLHGPATLDARARQDLGVAGFFPTLEAARASARVGTRPLVLKAVKRDGADLRLDPDAVKALAELGPRPLAEGHVAILIQ